MGSDDAVKRAAQRALNAAAAAALGPLGAKRRGRSGRNWYDDHGWWRINVWFNPSAWGVSVSLTVGVQYYWRRADHEYVESALEAGPVPPYPAGELDGSVAAAEVVAAVYAQDAVRQVLDIRRTHSDEREHFESWATLGRYERDFLGAPAPNRRFAGPVIANAALGRIEQARHLASQQRHLLAADPGHYLHAELSAELAELQDLIDAPEPRRRAEQWINQGRALLKLDPAPHVLQFLDAPDEAAPSAAP